MLWQDNFYCTSHKSVEAMLKTYIGCFMLFLCLKIILAISCRERILNGGNIFDGSCPGLILSRWNPYNGKRSYKTTTIEKQQNLNRLNRNTELWNDKRNKMDNYMKHITTEFDQGRETKYYNNTCLCVKRLTNDSYLFKRCFLLFHKDCRCKCLRYSTNKIKFMGKDFSTLERWWVKNYLHQVKEHCFIT
jgi:hypothetical protein